MFNAKFHGVLVVATVTAALVASTAMADRGQERGGPHGAMLLQKFDEVDANKDGMLTEAEIQAFHAARFASADTDGNGSLSVEELAAVQMQQMQARVAKRSAKMLERLDANNDGALSAEEMAGMEKSGKGKSMLTRADTDGDGIISKAEADAALADMAKHGGKHGKRGMDKGDD